MTQKAPEVLIVEDTEEMVSMLGNVLDNAGFRGDAVSTGGEALKRLKEFPETKVIILNYLLPDMSGLSVLEHVKSTGCQAEVIGISELKEARGKFMEAGAFAFLEKPFDFKEFAGLCQQAISRSNA